MIVLIPAILLMYGGAACIVVGAALFAVESLRRRLRRS